MAQKQIRQSKVSGWAFLLLLLGGLLANHLICGPCSLEWLSAEASGNKRFTIHVKLKDELGRMHSFKESVTKSTFRKLEAFGRRKATDFIERAKKALALKCGYDNRAFGQEVGRYVRCSLEKISVKDNRRGKWYTIWRPDRRTSI